MIPGSKHSNNPGIGVRCRSIGRQIALVSVCLALCVSELRAIEIVVPAYFYPGAGSPWVPMTAAADDVEITAIMNPFNGPGNSLDGNYVAAVNAFRQAGGRVIGYVYSSYTDRPLAQVLADVDRYEQWYNIDGIFVDEMANTGPAERLNYYKAIYDHVKAIDEDWEVMGNPGTETIEQYATWPTADRLMVFENTGAIYPGDDPSAWNANYDRHKFVHLVHTESSSTDMLAHLNLARDRNAGGIYITNDVMNNPWDTLPSYWQAEVNAVAAINASFAEADLNEDGEVDADDLSLWKNGFGDHPFGAWRRDGDVTDDETVDGADFLAWQRHVGNPGAVSSQTAAASVVPEPAAWLLATPALVLLLFMPVMRA